MRTRSKRIDFDWGLLIPEDWVRRKIIRRTYNNILSVNRQRFWVILARTYVSLIINIKPKLTLACVAHSVQSAHTIHANRGQRLAAYYREGLRLAQGGHALYKTGAAVAATAAGGDRLIRALMPAKRQKTGGFRTGGLYNGPTTVKANALRKEVKFTNSTVSQAITDAWVTIKADRVTATDAAFFATARDTSAEGRVGRIAFMRSLSFRGMLKNTADTTASSLQIRLVWVLDSQANGISATPAEVFDSEQSILSMPLVSNSKRFHIISDHTFSIKSSGANAAATPTYALLYDQPLTKQFNWKGNGKLVNYRVDDAAAVIANVMDNSLLCFAIADVTNIYTLNAQVRVRFTD